MNTLIRISFVSLMALLFVTSACSQKPSPLKLQLEPFKNEDFEISLPENWKPDHDDASFGWQDAQQMQEIRIIVMHIREGQSGEKAVDAYFDIRKSTLEQFSGGPVNISNKELAKSAKDEVLLKFRVDDKNRQVRMCTMVRANSRWLVSFTFLKYAPLLSFDEVEQRCHALVEKLAMKVG